jgi:Mn-dependent DtxR family transcriptional regulator
LLGGPPWGTVLLEHQDAPSGRGIEPRKRTMQVWKEFDDQQVTHSMAHYLMAIQDLLKEQGYARVTDVARLLEITPGSASVSLKALKAKGFVAEDRNRFLGLTEQGEKVARDVHLANRSFIIFFKDVLGVDPTQAEIDSCKIEHLVSAETRAKLLMFLQYSLSHHEPAKAFAEGFRHHQFACPGPDKCPLCDDLCEMKCLDEACKHDAEGSGQ